MSGELRRVAIAGLGLIGGSLARDLSSQGVRVLGWDEDADALRSALAAGVLSEALDADFSGLAEADALVLAAPVSAARALLERAEPHAGGLRLITDVCSTKRSVLAAASELGIGDRFVGSHPLAGDTRAGWDASRAGLFAGARVYLCAGAAGEAPLRLARALWTRVDAHPVDIGADAHDRLLAWTSHLPQLLSSSLGAALASEGIERAALGPGGRDVTRLAASSPGLWTDIVMDNRDVVTPGLAAVRDRLAGLITALETGDPASVEALLTTSQRWSAGAGG
jgi:prephenate dehydrogenase